MAVDHQQRHPGGLGFDHMPGHYSSSPHFTNPWGAATPSNPMYSLAPMSNDSMPKQLPAPGTVSMSYTTIPVSATTSSAGSNLPLPYGHQDLLSLSQDMLSANRLSATQSYGSEPSYSTASSPAPHNYAPTSAPFDTMSYTPNRSSYNLQPQQAPQQQHQQLQQQAQQGHERRLSQPSLPSSSFLGSPVDASRHQRPNSLVDFTRGLAPVPHARDSFGDTLDAGRGMVAMSQDATPRNIYAPRSGRDSADSYGFPSAHSTTSSISSSSTYPSYYGSVDSSVTDYSSTSESLDIPSRTLPPPQGLLGGSIPPNPQAMMSQFSSKVSSSTQKKHKCKICDKRFTRPSSLQTHMYSHTGEKPFSCDVEGCGRHFSVVSNLRRHRKVHKGEHETSSPAAEF
ncbi:MAG: hypothetical protein M1838_004857 [Thelocarpon superellum]|nr:MAG: hypothetical protein M1838_004857 [Thelocarpon superellum]